MITNSPRFVLCSSHSCFRFLFPFLFPSHFLFPAFPVAQGKDTTYSTLTWQSAQSAAVQGASPLSLVLVPAETHTAGSGDSALWTPPLSGDKVSYQFKNQVHMRHACHYPLIGTWLQLMFGSRSGWNQHACNFFPPSQLLERMLIVDIVAPTILSLGNWVSWLASYRVIPIDSWIKGWNCLSHSRDSQRSTATPNGNLTLQENQCLAVIIGLPAPTLSYWHKLCRYRSK